MRVFVAGATSAVGSRLTRLLLSSGHSVVGLMRTATKAAAIERAGAEVSVADALNRAAIVAAVTGAKPDVIVHEMTAISAANDPLARIAAGEHLVMLMTAARAGSNVKAKRHLGWEPQHASWRRGFIEVLEVRTP
jgi:nucleoside-diphosphate-sugar epimerase